EAAGGVVAVGGGAGEAVWRPTRTTTRAFKKKGADEARVQSRGGEKPHNPAMTTDGQRITMRANVELASEVESLSLFGAEGIGLYRSEYLFLNRLPQLPSEEEQYQVYRRLAEATGPAGASIRIFDLGGDKLSLEGFEPEQNPALGLRAIRLALRVDEIFRM